jgi:myosin heavy subunit
MISIKSKSYCLSVTAFLVLLAGNIQAAELNDAELDRNLRHYYENEEHPYCYCGTTLVSLNMRTQKKDGTPEIKRFVYGPSFMPLYEGKSPASTDVQPHMYAVVEECFNRCAGLTRTLH